MQLLAEYTVIYYYILISLKEKNRERETCISDKVIFSVFILFRIE